MPHWPRAAVARFGPIRRRPVTGCSATPAVADAGLWTFRKAVNAGGFIACVRGDRITIASHDERRNMLPRDEVREKWRDPSLTSQLAHWFRWCSEREVSRKTCPASLSHRLRRTQNFLNVTWGTLSKRMRENYAKVRKKEVSVVDSGGWCFMKIKSCVWITWLISMTDRRGIHKPI